MTLDHLGNVDMIDAKEAARRLGTKERFVRRLVSERRIRFYKYEDGHVRFDPCDIAEYIRQGRVEAIRPVLTYRKGGHAYA